MSAFKYFTKTECLHMFVRVRATADFSISVDGTAVSKDGSNSILEGPIQCDVAICSACMDINKVSRV